MGSPAGFPYEIHPLANLGEMQEAAVIELMDDIKRYGYNDDFPLKVMNGKLLDGRHRQEACLRLGIVPPVDNIKPKGGAAAYVASINSLKTYRKIDTKARMIYAAENFTTEGPASVQKRLGFSSSQYKAVLAAYKKSRRSKLTPNPWDVYKDGGTLKKLLEAFGIQSDMGSPGVQDFRDLQDTHNAVLGDVEMYQEMVQTRDDRIKELEKRVKSLDPQERIARAAEGDTTEEDRLRDRLEHTEESLKKSRKINEQLAERNKAIERMEFVARDVLSNVDWNGTVVNAPVLNRGKQTRPHQFLALMSDAHYGEVVNPSEALGISYNCDIAQRRIEHYRDTLIRFKDLREPAFGIEKLTVAVLGDMLSGSIHEELEIYNERNISQQQAEMAKILVDITKDLAGEFPEVEVVIIPGNHPRVKLKPQNKGKYDNFEHQMGNTVKAVIEADPRVSNVVVTVPQSLLHIHDIYGKRIGMYHGDGAKSNSFAGIPFYGLRQRRDAIQSLLSEHGQERIDMLVMGHFHQHLYWAGECDTLINGAIKGGDEYSINSFNSAPMPVQVLLEFHPEHGLAAQEHINLGHIN